MESMKMVRFWRRRNASAPSWMASLTKRISAVPRSLRSTQVASHAAKASERTLMTKMRPTVGPTDSNATAFAGIHAPEPPGS
jgi:hypothetical protein